MRRLGKDARKRSESIKASICPRPALLQPVAIEEELAMAGKSFSEDLSNEMAVKAVMWGPAIAGTVLLGPLGLALGLAASVAVVASGGSSKSSPPDGEQPESGQ